MTSTPAGERRTNDISWDDQKLPKHADQAASDDLGEDDAVGEDALQEDDSAPDDP